MAEEGEFVDLAYVAATEILKPPFVIRPGAALLSEVTVDNTLALTIDSKARVRGDSAVCFRDQIRYRREFTVIRRFDQRNYAELEILVKISGVT